MPPYPIIIPTQTSSSDYNIEICKTLETRQEIRQCLQDVKQQHDYINGAFSVFILTIIVGFIVFACIDIKRYGLW